MYTYLEDIAEIKTRHNFPYNLIAKVRDIELVSSSMDYYRFTIYNNNNNSEKYTCICKPSIIEKLNLADGDSAVIEYTPIKNFMDIGDVLLIRRIERPVFGLTGDKSVDVAVLCKIVKRIIESQFQDGSFDVLHHSRMNRAYLELMTAYSECHKEVKW